MRKYAPIMFVFASMVMLISPAGLGRAGVGVTSPSEPAVVPGTELHDNVAYIKDGYKFVDHGDSVDVVREGSLGVKMGTYTCPCHRKDGTGKCEMVFTTRRISCRTGSCIGVSCLLTGSTLIKRR